MEAKVSAPNQTRTTAGVCRRLACPVCEGPLVETRGSFRCARCHYTFCEGCGGGEGEPFVGGDVPEE